MPVPAELTRVAPEPTLPAGPITNEDLVELIGQLRAWGRDANARLRKIAELGESRPE